MATLSDLDQLHIKFPAIFVAVQRRLPLVPSSCPEYAGALRLGRLRLRIGICVRVRIPVVTSRLCLLLFVFRRSRLRCLLRHNPQGQSHQETSEEHGDNFRRGCLTCVSFFVFVPVLCLLVPLTKPFSHVVRRVAFTVSARVVEELVDWQRE